MAPHVSAQVQAAATAVLALLQDATASPPPPAPPAPLAPAARAARGLWVRALLELGARYFSAAAAAFASPAGGNDAEFKRDSVTIVRAARFADAARDFVELLRARAHTSIAAARAAAVTGLKDVDGRISYHVPAGSVLRAALIAFARAARPEVLPSTYPDASFDVSFLYLILTVNSQSQEMHVDYNDYMRSLVFLLPLDDAVGTTQFQRAVGVKLSDAAEGDLVAFGPWLPHAGIATERLRRCMYASIRVLSGSRTDDTAFAAAHVYEKTFTSGSYNDCVPRNMAAMEAADAA